MFFSGFAGQFGHDLARSRQEEAEAAERQAALESSILQHLSTSTDPEIQSHAITGLLDLAGPKRAAKGLSGWLGKVAQNPALPTIRQLIQAGRVEEVPQADVPRGTPGPAQEAPPGVSGGPQASALTPRTMGPPSPDDLAVEAPSPPPSLTPPPGPGAVSGPTYRTVPRQLFDTPEQVAEKTARGTTRGTLQGKVDVMRGGPGQPGLTEEEMELLFPGRTPLSVGTVQGKDTPYGSVDNAGRPLTPTGYYTVRADPRDPSRVTYFPSATPAHVLNQQAIASRPTFQRYAGPDGKTPAVWRVARDGSFPPEFVGYIPQRGSYLDYVNPDTGEVTYTQAPAPMTPVPASPAAPGAGGPPTAAAPPPSAPARAQAGPTAPPAPGGAARPGGPPAAGPAGIPGGRRRALKETEGAYLGPGGEPQKGFALFDNVTGKYYAAEDPAREATGFIPGPEGAAIINNYASANNTLVMIAAAKRALEQAGLTRDTSQARAATMLAKFYQGKLGDDPAASAVTSLTNLAALQGATQYVRSNSRSWQMFQQASVHLPRPPSERVAALTQQPIIGNFVTPELVALAGGHGWDSFAAMYEKLNQAEKMIMEGKAELATLTGKVPERAIGGGGPPAPGGAGASAVPPEVQQLLQGKPPKRYVLSDGSVWVVDASGTIRPGG